jgi:hypothetical protein
LVISTSVTISPNVPTHWSKSSIPAFVEQVRAQVLRHHVLLGDAVRDRRAGGERGDAAPLPGLLPQVVQLGVQVGGPAGPVDRAGTGRRRRQVLEVVRLVDHQVVDAGLLERQRRVHVLGARDELLELRLTVRQTRLGLLERRVLLGRRVSGRPLAGLRELLGLLVDVPLDRGRRHGDRLERLLGEDDGVPVAGGGAGDEPAPLVPGQVVGPGGEELRLRVQLQVLAGELLEHVVRDDDGRLLHQAEAPQLLRAHDHLGGLPGADDVVEEGGGLVDDAVDGRVLVAVDLRLEPDARPGMARSRESPCRITRELNFSL